MEQLTPELERRLQVEELWARRNVLCDTINARRRENFRARHIMLSRLGTQALPLPAHVLPEAVDAVPAKSGEQIPQIPKTPAAAPQPMRPIMLEEPSGARQVLRFAGFAVAAAALLVIGMQGNELVATARTQLQSYVPRLMEMVSGHQLASAAPPHASASHVPPPDLRAEVAAEIAAAMDRKR